MIINVFYDKKKSKLICSDIIQDIRELNNYNVNNKSLGIGFNFSDNELEELKQSFNKGKMLVNFYIHDK